MLANRVNAVYQYSTLMKKKKSEFVKVVDKFILVCKNENENENENELYKNCVQCGRLILFNGNKRCLKCWYKYNQNGQKTTVNK